MFATKQHTLPDLSYAYNALEPYINEEIMRRVNALSAAETAFNGASSHNERAALPAALQFCGGSEFLFRSVY
jgi:hypothetical protein